MDINREIVSSKKLANFVWDIIYEINVLMYRGLVFDVIKMIINSLNVLIKKKDIVVDVEKSLTPQTSVHIYTSTNTNLIKIEEEGVLSVFLKGSIFASGKNIV